MVLRWAVFAFPATEKNFRRFPGCEDPRKLKAKLEDSVVVDSSKMVA